MAESATIFIPDISGYTAFMSKTALEHSSHIVNELLEVLAESNSTGCTLAEIEGDALLFYRKGEPIATAEMIRQCLVMFESFHTRLKIIERDSICQCGACQTASNLTLKFIIHYGTIKEIKVANFTKASGIDMIIAHRLLKNSIASDEYILATRDYADRASNITSYPELTWQSASEEYPAVGTLEFNFALLEQVKSRIPDPPAREDPAIVVGDNSLEIDIAAPMLNVYQLLIDLGRRQQWVQDMKDSEGDKPIDRVGVQHRCIFEDMTVEVTPVKSESHDGGIHYVESSYVPSMELKSYYDYLLTPKSEKLTNLKVSVGAESEMSLPPEVTAMLMTNIREGVASFKQFCEVKQG